MVYLARPPGSGARETVNQRVLTEMKKYNLHTDANNTALVCRAVYEMVCSATKTADDAELLHLRALDPDNTVADRQAELTKLRQSLGRA